MHEIRHWRAAACALVLAAVAATAAGADDDDKAPLEKQAGATKAMLAAQCGGYRRDQARAASAPAASAPGASADRLLAAAMMKMTCECMPQAIDDDVATRGAGTLMTAADAAVEMKAATALCTARMVREGTQALCAAGQDPFARRGSPPISADRQRARCACVQAGTARLTDREIADATMASYRDYVAKAKARTEGASDPAPTPNALHDMEQACRAEDAAR